MALRKILTEGDEQLLKHSRKVEKFDDRLHTLIDDMRKKHCTEMYSAFFIPF